MEPESYICFWKACKTGGKFTNILLPKKLLENRGEFAKLYYIILIKFSRLPDEPLVIWSGANWGDRQCVRQVHIPETRRATPFVHDAGQDLRRLFSQVVFLHLPKLLSRAIRMEFL